MTIIDEGRFDPAEFEEELAEAPRNLDVGTTLRFENERVRVWDITLQPGERGPFHAHTRPYFWTVVSGSRGLQRFDDGRFLVRDYSDGDTMFLMHSADDVMIHDLENVGDNVLRFVTVELVG